jgi:hypothetical protein
MKHTKYGLARLRRRDFPDLDTTALDALHERERETNPRPE